MKPYKKVSKKTLYGVIQDLVKVIHALREENDKLRALVEGMRICAEEDADGCECPLYDTDEPYRCKMDRLMEELGLSDE